MALLQITEPGQSVDPHDRKRAAGIDLGTTNSLIASVRGGVTDTLPDLAGEHLLPSAVRYQASSPPVVGRAALDMAAADPLNTIVSVKRLLGRGVHDVSTLGNVLPYQFRGGEDGMPFISTVAGDVSPVAVSAEIIRHLVTRAEASLAGELDGVVITVPAYFDEAQRQATKDAARVAGVKVLRLLNEPTAAAVAYGLDSGDEGVVAVYDFGGGTFDISLLRLTQGVFEVLATGGNSSLGGDDLDRAIAEALLQRADFSDDLSQRQLRTLLMEARQIKEALSSADEVDIDLEVEGLVLRTVMTRDEASALMSPFIDDSIRACRRCVRDASVDLADISSVVLVGGSTRVPLVRERVTAYFGAAPKADIDPDRVVAIGAAAQANVLAGNKSDDEMLLLDVLPLSLGLETMGGLTEKVIHRNTPIPVARAQEFTTFKDGQTAMLIHVLQGERELVDDCRSLARFELTGIPPMVAGAARIEVLFQVDADGLLAVSATEGSTGVAASVEVKPTYGLEEDEILTMLRASFDNAGVDAGARAVAEARVNGLQVADALDNALAADGESLLSAQEYSTLRAGAADLRALADADDKDAIVAATESLGRMSEDFAGRRMDASVRRLLAGHQIDEFADGEPSDSPGDDETTSQAGNPS
jgi:molecular chaperone HscA